MADDPLDELHWADPASFTALRTRLSAAAKQRGDTATARQISSTNRPTRAAWVINRLALDHREVQQRLTDLGDRLRDAHAAMDGDRIRDLSAEQRKLVDDLARAAFEAAELKNPSAALREEVTGTLQAAIADPEVTAALGRLTKPQRWSGFGAISGATAGARQPTRKARQRQEAMRAALTQAERAKADADDVLAERHAARAAARLRRKEAVQRLRAAERELSTAEANYDKAQQASRDCAESVRQAKARVVARRRTAGTER